MTQQKEVLQSISPVLSALQSGVESLADKRAEFFVTSALMGIANRAAFSVETAEKRAEDARQKGADLIADEGAAKSESQLARIYDDMTFWSEQVPVYRELYAACADTFQQLTGKAMPNQYPSAQRARKREMPSAQQLRSAFGVETPAEAKKAATANKAGTASRRRAAK